MKTELKDRTLFYDGDSAVEPSKLLDMILTNGPKGIFSKSKVEGIAMKTECSPIPEPEWTIPKEYLNKDIQLEIIDLADSIGPASVERVKMEFELYNSFDMIESLQALAYVKDMMVENNVVWGVGRGSSVSSYVLFLMGIHSVDSLKYELDISEFLR